MMNVLNSQSDSIVVVEKRQDLSAQNSYTTKDQDEDRLEGLNCNVQFLNSKSVELLGFDISLSTQSNEELKKVLEHPKFVPTDGTIAT